MMKTITLEEARKRIKSGDLFYSVNKYGEHTGWRLYLGKYHVGLTTEIAGSWGGSEIGSECVEVKKVVFANEIHNPDCLAKFFHDFDEEHIKDFIYKLVDNKKEIELEQLVEKLKNQLDEATRQLQNIKEDK